MTSNVESRTDSPAPVLEDYLMERANAEPVLAGSDRPFLLASDDVWVIVSGAIDVFIVRVEADEPVGSRSHFMRVRERGALFGTTLASEERRALLCVGTHGARLLRLRRADLESADPRTGPLAGLVGSWVDALHTAMTRDKLPAISAELTMDRETEVGQSQCVRVPLELAWVRHVEGWSRLMGRDDLAVNGEFVPLTRRAWLEPAVSSRLLAVSTEGLPSSAEVWSGLDRLHRVVRRFAEIRTRAADAATRDRMQRKGSFQKALLHNACERLARTMRSDAGAAPRAAETEADGDPLFAACDRVAADLGLSAKRHARHEGAPPPRDPLAAILHASRLRARRVALRGTWWRENGGPLLAYLADGKRPVALLHGRRGQYVLYDAGDGSERLVDAAVAERLEPFAQSLYRPFPAISLNIRDVARFGLFGSGRDILVVFAMVAGATLVGMVPAVATGMLFNTVIPGAQRAQLLQLTLVLAACAIVNTLLGLAQSIALLRVESRGSAALQAAVWDRLLSVPLPFFRPYPAGALAVRAMAIDSIRQVVSGSTINALVGSVTALGNFGLMYWYSPTLAVWATLIIVLVMSVTLGGTWVQRRPQREMIEIQAKLSGLVLQLLTSIAKLRVAAAEIPAFARWVRHFSDQRRLQYKVRRVGNVLAALQAGVPLLASLVIFWLATPLIVETHQLQTGDFMAFMAAFATCMGALLSSSTALLATLNTIPLYEQAKPILETLPEVDLAKNDPGVLTGDIEIQHAMFRYQADGPLVLRDVSIHVRSGEFVALVGASGSGKSTLLRLLLGFERMEAGTIYYDGQEIGGMDVQALRRQMGVVLQSGRLMSGDIMTNIIGSSSATLDHAWAAARMAGLEEDIRAMPMGMHTVISEGAGTLSGGQRQRLLIARAIVNRPRILLFDEATSALDNRTQAIVSASLESLQATRVVVAHRLSTIQNADRIFVMERGQLVQSGTYAQLIAQPGPFAELAKRQIA
jgi:ATP-binding cassette subfamily C protein